MRSRYLITLLGLSLDASAAGAVKQADMLHMMPPPGLYQIESSDATTSVASMGLSTREQGSGNVNTRTDRTPDGQVLRRQLSAPQSTICVPARRPGVPVMPSKQSDATCKNVSSNVNGDTLVLVAQCQTGRLTQTIRRVGDNQWEFGVDTEFGGGGTNVAALRPMLEMMARNGATAADREKARRQLAALPQLKAESDQQLSAATNAARREAREGRTPEDRAVAQKMVAMLGNPASVAPQIKAVGTERWTRIGDSCAAVGH